MSLPLELKLTRIRGHDSMAAGRRTENTAARRRMSSQKQAGPSGANPFEKIQRTAELEIEFKPHETNVVTLVVRGSRSTMTQDAGLLSMTAVLPSKERPAADSDFLDRTVRSCIGRLVYIPSLSFQSRTIWCRRPCRGGTRLSSRTHRSRTGFHLAVRQTLSDKRVFISAGTERRGSIGCCQS